MKTLNSPDGNWLRRRNSSSRPMPASRSFALVPSLPLGMEYHYGENRINNQVVGQFEVLLFRWQRTIHEITRSVTKQKPSSCGFVWTSWIVLFISTKANGRSD